MYDLLQDFYRYGFVIFKDVPVEDNYIVKFANSVGTIRPTNFGESFSVKSVPEPNDLAYTSIALTPHTDNPSRENLASSIFLNTPDECAGGTAFYEDGQMLGHVEMKYNRMIMYNQCAEHSGYLPEGSFESDLWRISQQFFI